MAKTISIFSTKGGVGKTTVALNIAVSLSLKKKKVLILDLDLGAPLDMVKMFGVKPKKAMVDLFPVWERIKKDAEALRLTFLTHINPHLHFLPAVLSLKTASYIDSKHIDNVFGVLKTLDYDYIIIDGGDNLSDILIKIFDYSNLILLILTPDILSLYQVEWILDALQSVGFPLHMIKGVLNRSESKGSVKLREIKMLLPIDLFSQVPSDGVTAGLALNRQIPVVLDSPNSRLSLAIESLAKNLLYKENIYISPTQLSELRIKKEDVVEEKKKVDIWTSLGLTEPLKEVEIKKDEDVIIALKKRIHQNLLEEMNLKRLPVEVITMDVEKTRKLRMEAEKILANILAKEAHGFIASFEVRKKLTKEIIDEALGLGPLEELIRDPLITEIMVNNKDQIYVERDGKIEITNKRFTSNEQVKLIIDRIVAPLGRRLDETTPYVDARLPDGSRVNAIISPLSLTGPTLTIRKFPFERLTIRELVEQYGSLNNDMAKFLEAAVRSRKNILVSGGTGSGKTTLLNILSEFIPENERIVSIEDAAELKLSQDHWIRLEAKPPNIEGKGEISIRDLFRNSLRMRPDRIIVGEVRGKEVLDMLQAMNTGHDGSLSTVHANSPGDVVIRLDSMILMSGIELPLRAIREMVSSALDLIVHTARLSDGTRKVVQITEIAEIIGETQLSLKDIFAFTHKGVTPEGKIVGEFSSTGYTPTFYKDIISRGISLSQEIFSSHT